MSEAQFRFYEELNDHLPSGRRKRSFAHQFSGRTPVAELIRALGVPLLVLGWPVPDGPTSGATDNNLTTECQGRIGVVRS